jgi:hypothetical protein
VWFAVLAFMLLAVVACLLMTQNVHIVQVRVELPEGYRGAFAIVQDASAGIVPQTSGGFYVFRIPQSGRLLVRDLTLFEEKCQFSFGDVSGKALNVEILGTRVAVKPKLGEGVWESTTYEDGAAVEFRTIP